MAEGVHVALLRGINVGGRNKVPMKGLAAMFAEARCLEVQTYVQSGNVVFEATDAIARRVPSLVGQALLARLGLRIPLVMRTAAELRAAARGNPFLKAGADPATLHVAFLADRPEAARVAALDAARSPPDELAVRGREIYLRCPGGYGRSRLTNQYFDSRLGTVSTVRNWRTVLALLELASAREPRG
jgi:uncharacterized protein (DUF1697 family)